MRLLRYVGVVAMALGLSLGLSLGPAESLPLNQPIPSSQSVDDLVRQLNASDARTRRKAVTSLAKLNTEEVWEVIADKALGDQEAQVADEAQLQFGKASASEALFEALGSKMALRARDELVRERAAEALGRIEGPVPVGLFVSCLKDKEPTVRAAAAYAIELRARRGGNAFDLSDAKGVSAVRKALAKVAFSDREPRVRANGILGIAAFSGVDEGSRELAAKAIVRRDKSPLLRAASLLASREVNTLADLVAGLLDVDQGVAMLSLRLLDERGDVASVKALSEALPNAAGASGAESGSVERPALVAAMVASLRDASGLSHGAVRERWIRWAEGLDPKWRRESASKKRKAGKGEESGSTSFYGLRLDSDRLVFLVDMSGSMWEKNGETSRKEQVEVELAKALRGLPETAMFNVIPYATDPGPWQDGLVQATERNVEKAVQWFERNTLRGRGDLWSALLPVLRDPTVDTVVILSDGAPSGGDRWNVELWRSLLQDENRLRGVVIHAVMFDASGFLKKAWKEIVGDSGGVQQLID